MGSHTARRQTSHIWCYGALACAMLHMTHSPTFSLASGESMRRILPLRAKGFTAVGASSKQHDLVAGDVVTVIGASGNVGKLTTLRLTDEDYKVRAVVRSVAAKNRLIQFLGDERSKRVEFFQADTAVSPDGLDDALQGAAAAIVCTGTTAFPTKAWAGGGVGADDIGSTVWQTLTSNGFDVRRGLDSLTAAGLNTPDAVDARGVERIVAAASRAVASGFKRLILMSSIGVTRRTGFPFVVLNAAGVLDAKARGESAARTAAERDGFSWTVVRPGQLFGGPYDNNFYLGTLFKLDKDIATRAVTVEQGDTIAGDTLRSALAEVLVQTLASPFTHNTDFTVINIDGDAPSAAAIQEQLSAALLVAA